MLNVVQEMGIKLKLSIFWFLELHDDREKNLENIFRSQFEGKEREETWVSQSWKQIVCG